MQIGGKMSDIKRAFEKAGIKGGGGEMKKKCKVCGKPLKDDSRFDTCFDCGQKNKKGGGGGDLDSLPPEYITKLEKGYFDSGGCLWEEFLTKFADKIAKSFRGLKNHQLRRFYGHIKAADNRLRMTEDWRCVNLDIKKLLSFVSEAKGKDKVPESFYKFIDANINKIKEQKDFEAFVEHFQAIVAYFTYHYPKN
jgi:CRISPR-associated protein Csm2